MRDLQQSQFGGDHPRRDGKADVGKREAALRDRPSEESRKPLSQDLVGPMNRSISHPDLLGTLPNDGAVLIQDVDARVGGPAIDRRKEHATHPA